MTILGAVPACVQTVATGVFALSMHTAILVLQVRDGQSTEFDLGDFLS
jgi:hypothetical protein